MTRRTTPLTRTAAAALAAAALMSFTAVAAATRANAADVATTSEGKEWVVGDQFNRVLVDHALKPSDSERWEGRCPSTHPYLDDRVAPSGMGGSPKGFTVRKETDWLAIGEGAFVRSYAPVPGKPGWDYVTGTAGTVTNWSATYQHLYVQMTCTSTPTAGWMVY